MCVKSSNHEEQ